MLFRCSCFLSHLSPRHSHPATVSFQFPEAIRTPSLNILTLLITLKCPCNSSFPHISSRCSHTPAVLSQLPKAIRSPSLDILRLTNASLYLCSSSLSHISSHRFHKRRVQLQPPETIRLPSLDKLTLSIRILFPCNSSLFHIAAVEKPHHGLIPRFVEKPPVKLHEYGTYTLLLLHLAPPRTTCLSQSHTKPLQLANSRSFKTYSSNL